MADHPGVEIFLTREVRWFRDGTLPESVASWFTSAGSLGHREHRVDRYEQASAREGIGIKYRNATSLDAKFRLADEGSQALAAGLEGRVEDWIKVTQPQPAFTTNGGYVAVEKDIVTRRYHLQGRAGDGSDELAGCDVELAAVRIGDTRAWSLGLETFGSPGRREDALVAGLDGLSRDTPLPEELDFGAHASFGYPAWISRHLG